MKRAVITVASLMLAVAAFVASAPPPADAAIHELVAAYCSGGGVGVISSNGFLEPPGVTDPTRSNFAQPARSTGVVVGSFPNLTIGSSPAAKFTQGTNVLTGLNSSTANHPSAANCQRNALPSP